MKMRVEVLTLLFLARRSRPEYRPPRSRRWPVRPVLL